MNGHSYASKETEKKLQGAKIIFEALGTSSQL